ncbi:BMP family protein [Pendulispora albinea]|uniref:BMP family ABC transporter substrate-binding protein n=1 Tax=Pendulispora albinea TaxID=2741071 RepID=A0ABZ2LNG9_9BACT
MIRAGLVVGLMLVIALVLTFLPGGGRGRARANDAKTQSPRPGAPTARVGLVFDIDGRGDKSFNDAAYLGLMRARDELGAEVSYLEPGQSEDREAGLRLYASRNLDLVIGVGFIFSSDVDAVARAYPHVSFACVDYAPGPEGPPPNVAGLSFREEEGSFLVGAAAGLVSKTGHVGFVGGMTIPLIRKFEAGYIAGVKATCPTCEVHSAYAGATPEAFKDPAKGKTLAMTEVAAGADVVYHASGATGHGVFEGARDAHVLAIGVDSDQYDEMPEVVLTSMVKRVDVAVFEAVRSAIEHRFRGGILQLGVRDHGIDYVHEGPHAARLPPAVTARVEELRAGIIAGTIAVPAK